MPYKLSNTDCPDGKFGVINTETGEQKGCSNSKEEAAAHMRALYAHEKELKELSEEDIATLVEEALWFDDQEDIEELDDEQKEISVAPIVIDSKTTSAVVDFFKGLFVKEAPFQTRNGKKYHSRDFYYVPDPQKPSTWKLLKTGTPGGSPDAFHTAAALAALGSAPPHGQGAQVGGKKAGLRERIKRDYNRTHPDAKKETSMMIWKDALTGQYRWFGIYSNNFRDKDQEIIAAKSHQRFVEMVDKGEAEYPDLMHWHMKEFTWGKADWLAFDDETGMSMASGYILPGHEGEAEAVKQYGWSTRMSHGMPVSSIVRDPDDKRVIIEHKTIEVSDLPAWAAANELTSFSILGLETTDKEASMAIPDAKKKYLLERGLTEETIAAVLEANAAVSDKAISEGVDTKENEAAVETPAETNEQPVATEAKESTPEVPAQAEQTLTAKDIAIAVSETLKPVIEKMNELETKINALEVQTVETANKAKELELTPTLSLGAMIAQNLSAIGTKEAHVPANAQLAKDKPAEEKPADNTSTGDPIADVVGRIIAGKSLGG